MDQNNIARIKYYPSYEANGESHRGWALETLQDDGSWEVYRVYKAHRAEGSKELEENYIAAHMLGEIVNLLDWGYSIHMAGQDE